jgi:hypothetical protein
MIILHPSDFEKIIAKWAQRGKIAAEDAGEFAYDEAWSRAPLMCNNKPCAVPVKQTFTKEIERLRVEALNK